MIKMFWIPLNPIRIDLFGARWYWGGANVPSDFEALPNLKYMIN